MSLKSRVLLNTFAASFAATLLQRGAYFFTHDVLAFTQAQNLWFALMFGVVYVAGASASHPVSARLGERRTLVGVIAGLALAHFLIAANPTAAMITVVFAVIGVLQGMMWPLFESYMSAGETPEKLGRALGRYNICWALSVPPSLALAGPLIASGKPWLLFVVAATVNAAVALSCLAFPHHPPHLEASHSSRPDALALARVRPLLLSARFAMLESYLLLLLLAPLMPEIMTRVGFGVAAATRASSLLDVARLACFLGLFLYAAWHNRKAPLAFAAIALPVGFFLVLFGNTATLVLSGEILFGLAAGFLYTAALYYAQLVQNASVDAGGAHEALIGVGYALGPSAGLIGTALAHGAGPGTTDYVHGMTIAILPLIALCTAGALYVLVKPVRVAVAEARANNQEAPSSRPE